MASVTGRQDMLLQRLRERLEQEDLELIDLRYIGQDALFAVLASLGFNPIDRVKVQSVLRIFADEGGAPGSQDLKITCTKSSRSNPSRDPDPPNPARPRTYTYVPRKMQLRRHVLEKYGYTDGCLGCRGMQEYREIIPPHRDACRARIAEAMAVDPDGQRRLEEQQRRMEGAAGANPPENEVPENSEVRAREAAFDDFENEHSKRRKIEETSASGRRSQKLNLRKVDLRKVVSNSGKDFRLNKRVTL